jgi:hypothetical protein
LFRRQKRAEAVAETARELERRALFERLAQRPDNVCPFLALADDRVGYRPGPTDEHRCYAFGDPAPLSSEQQSRVCLQRGYGNCPRYLRGILVIPTEELEALRRPQPMPVAAPPPPPAEERSGRRGLPLLLAGVLVLLLAGGGAGFLLTRDRPAAVVVPPASSPSPSGVSSASASSTVAATPSAASVTPLPTPTIEPTPAPNDTFDHFEVSVAPGSYTIYRIDAAGNLTDPRTAVFDNYSQATVTEVESPRRSWLVQNGDYAGYSYVAEQSGPFRIRRVYLSPSGERRADYLAPGEL